MMIGEHLPHSNPTVQIPSWDPFLDEPTSPLPSPFSNATTSPFLDSLTALHRYLPSNEPDSFSDDFDVASPRGNRSGSGPSDMEIGSPLRHHFDSYFTKAGSFGSSPTSILTSPPLSPSDSPPISPSSPQVTGGSFGSFNSASELVASMRSLQLGKMKIGHATASWVMQNRPGFGSSRGSSLRPNFCSLPTTPTRIISRVGPGQQDFWDCSLDEEPVMERVESGRDLKGKDICKT
ncbi:hypothetical protein RCOM_0798880 [Ricinus communis]|uniref:Uncharacterized protein n=1 Tax=Ricinus communis TaxID=3988 RepID=B9RRW9_RICCO|nr:hypothetical protein RCOM_0798880 [Ricinus communis]